MEKNSTECAVCGWEAEPEDQAEWVPLGCVESQLLADMASETLHSMQIPVVVTSRDGFFGRVGLPLTPIFKPGGPKFTISVPAAWASEAASVLESTLGDKFQRGEV